MPAVSPTRAFPAISLVLALAFSAPATAHPPPEPDEARLGKVTFKVECNAAAQKEFNRSIALIHSFAWKRSLDSLDAVLKADPSCGMAHWGRAMALLDNPYVWPGNLTPPRLAEISAALDAARKAGLKTQREKDYVEAVAVFVREPDKNPYPQRLAAYETAMHRIVAAHKDDLEASIFAALVTSASFNPADKTYANQLKAARMLEPLFKAHPHHPGIAHYLIHSYDYPPIAKHGLEAARAYAKIAPDATHALHMPSHIFTRLGHWKDSIAANRASAKAASEKQFDGHHASDYMVYAHMQIAEDAAARKVVQQNLAAPVVDHFASGYAYAAMPARLLLERGAWKQAAALTLKPGPDAFPWKKYPQAESVNAFARGIGAARSGDAAAARAEQARLVALRDAAKELKLGYWADQIDIQAEIVGGLALCAERKVDACIEAMRKVADREDATEKHVVTPGPILPARELLAEVLLHVARRPADALTAYEAVLIKEPGRLRAMAGAMEAARLTGNRARAAELASAILRQAGRGDTARPSIATARQIAGR